MSDFLAQFVSQGSQLLGPLWPVVWSLIKIICVVLPVMGCLPDFMGTQNDRLDACAYGS